MFVQVESTYSDTTQYLPYRHRLGYIRWQRGDKTEAKTLFKEELKLDSARVLGKTGIGSWGDVRNVYYDLAITHAFMGNKESAHKCFDELFKRGIPSWMFWYLENDLMLTEFRKEPRFIEFFKKFEKQKQFRIDAMKAAINRYEAGKELKERVK
jgi:tetratricopeptide (TPR) repeat protein